MLPDAAAVSRAVETAFFKHVFTRDYDLSVGFASWRGRKSEAVAIVADEPGRLVPLEVKCRHQHAGAGDLHALATFCTQNKIPCGDASPRDVGGFGVMPLNDTPAKTRLLKSPAPLACDWLGQSELLSTRARAEES